MIKAPEASTFNTVLILYCCFLYVWLTIMSHIVIPSLQYLGWMLCAIRECDMNINLCYVYDDNIPLTMERF